MLACGMTKKPRNPKYEPQAKYQAKKEAEGAYVQINVKLKTAADLKMWERLRSRFEDESPSGIARMGLRELDKKRN